MPGKEPLLANLRNIILETLAVRIIERLLPVKVQRLCNRIDELLTKFTEFSFACAINLKRKLTDKSRYIVNKIRRKYSFFE